MARIDSAGPTFALDDAEVLLGLIERELLVEQHLVREHAQKRDQLRRLHRLASKEAARASRALQEGTEPAPAVRGPQPLDVKKPRRPHGSVQRGVLLGLLEKKTSATVEEVEALAVARGIISPEASAPRENTRNTLRRLVAKGLVAHSGREYSLTSTGHATATEAAHKAAAGPLTSQRLHLVHGGRKTSLALPARRPAVPRAWSRSDPASTRALALPVSFRSVGAAYVDPHRSQVLPTTAAFTPVTDKSAGARAQDLHARTAGGLTRWLAETQQLGSGPMR